MAILTVGSGQQFTTLTAAVAAAQPGDTIEIQAGTYTNDFPGYVNGLTIEGVGGQASFVATEQPPNGKAIIDEGGNTTLKNLSFSGVTVPDGNGAGVRYEGGTLDVEDSVFTGNQDGLLGAPDPNGSITINQSEFGGNGTTAGNTHNIYIGDVQQFTLTNSYVHDANTGHEVKSRAENNT
ncbi:MAG: right-handed parallel beta-helix repeat-containing protein, partial [Acetobacteraceae bacterium]|nr:right-handed parallel beta-helix repeat-containing protein [Acetobacteraceae bacterium]